MAVIISYQHIYELAILRSSTLIILFSNAQSFFEFNYGYFFFAGSSNAKSIRQGK